MSLSLILVECSVQPKVRNPETEKPETVFWNRPPPPSLLSRLGAQKAQCLDEIAPWRGSGLQGHLAADSKGSP